jgi:hypothetical protein
MKKIARAAVTLTAGALTAAAVLAAVPATATAPSSSSTPATASASPRFDADTLKTLRQAIRLVERMPESERMQARAARHGLNVLNVLWEDTGRFEGSSVGPNISDVTLQLREPVDTQGTRFRQRLLPVLRHPNFSDKTADIAAEKLWVKVGNQSAGAQLVSVPLTEVLKNLREYVSNPESIKGSGDFSAPRDSHMLVSAQHVFVPIPQTGKIEFTPVIFNYQSSRRRPAVLTLLVTRQGTSVVAIENDGTDAITDWDSGMSGQQLFFNHKGHKTTLTAERKSDVKARIEAGLATAQDAGALEEGADMMLIIQVPLKVRAPRNDWGYGTLGAMGTGAGGYGLGIGGLGGGMPAPAKSSSAPMAEMESKGAGVGMGDAGGGRGRRSDVEQAIIGHGDDLGEFNEGHGLRMERDPRFPVRVTVQFYKATSNGVVSDDDLVAAKRQIDQVYARGDFVGSLVVPEGQRHRPTDWHLGHTQPVPIVHKTTTLPTPDDLDTGDLDAVDSAVTTTSTAETVEATPSRWARFKAWLLG